MSECSFNRLVQFVNKRLDLDGQLETYRHLDRCEICRDAVYELSRDRRRTTAAIARTTIPFVLPRRASAAVQSLRPAR